MFKSTMMDVELTIDLIVGQSHSVSPVPMGTLNEGIQPSSDKCHLATLVAVSLSVR